MTLFAPQPARWHSPRDRARCRRCALWWGLAASLVLLALTLLDRAIWRALLVDNVPSLITKEWYQVLRQFGYAPVWLILGVALILNDRHSRGGLAAWHRGLMVIAAAALSGLFAEFCKETVRRARPLSSGLYTFDWGASAAFNFPPGFVTSHGATAFGGAIMLGWFFPGARWLLLALACGTSLSRLLVGAHFATDAFLALLLAYGVCHALWAVFATFPGGARWKDRSAERA